MKIEIKMGRTKPLVGLTVLLMPSVIGLVLGYGTTQPGSSGHSLGEAEVSGRIMSANIQGRSMKQQDISQSLPKSLRVSSALGLGESVPSSTTCTQQTHIGGKSYRTPPNPASMVLVPHDVIVHNNKIAVRYVLDTQCSADCNGTNYHYDRYYYGNDQWSDCFAKIQSCSPPCSSLR